MRQAFAGMLWSKQLYYYDVARWLDGDPTQPTPPPQRLTGRNSRWRNFDAFDIMSMPDKWEYPWFAAWDLAFHCVALAHVDPAFAKYQLILLCREWFQHPNGALPAYEWDFGDVNPPVQAWAALEVFAIDGGRDIEFLSRVFDKLLVNFTWWVNREDAEGNNLFEGGFLGLDNIGPIDRSHLPVGGTLEQSDATGWMGFYAIAMGGIAAVLNRSGQRPAGDLVLKFLEHFAAIRRALDGQGLWDEADGLYYDRLVTPSGQCVPVRHRSMVGIIPVLAAAVIDEKDLERALVVGKQFADLLGRDGLSDTSKLHETGRAARGAGPPAAAAQPGRPGPAGAAARLAVQRERVPLPAWPARPVGLAPRASVRARRRRHPGQRRLRAGRIDHGHVRRELQLARPGLVPAELPGDQRAGALPPVLRRRASPSSTRPGRASSSPWTWSPRPVRPAHLDLHPRAGRPPALLRRDRAAAERSGLARQPDLQRVLPRRQRRRDRRLAPDRLDRADRRRDPPPPRRGPRRRRRHPGRRPGGPSNDRRSQGRRSPRCPEASSRWAPPSAMAARTSRWPRPSRTGCCSACSTRAARRRRSRCRTTTPGSGTASSRGRGRPGLRVPGHRALRPGSRRPLQSGEAAAGPLRAGRQRIRHLRARRPGLCGRRSGHPEHRGLRRQRATEPGGGRRRIPLAGRRTHRATAGSPTRSSTNCTSRASPCAIRGFRRSCAEPMPGWATKRPSPT